MDWQTNGAGRQIYQDLPLRLLGFVLLYLIVYPGEETDNATTSDTIKTRPFQKHAPPHTVPTARDTRFNSTPCSTWIIHGICSIGFKSGFYWKAFVFGNVLKRWERGRFLNFGLGASPRGNAQVANPDRRSDQQDLIEIFGITCGDKIELTSQTVHSGVYQTSLSREKGQLKIKRTAHAAKVQHNIHLGDQSFIRASFGKVEQTKLGGAVLLAKLEKETGLVRGAAQSMIDPRNKSQIQFTLFDLVWQRVLLICCGYEDGHDVALLAHDPGLRLALLPDLQRELASQPTISRFENKISLANSYRLAVFLVLFYIQSKRKIPRSIRLDFDGTCIPTFGRQEGSSYRSYYGTNMYFPLFVFDEDGVLITAILRPGKDGEARLSLAVLKRLTKAFRIHWPNAAIKVVMDAGFNDQKIYDWCEDNNVRYLIKLKNCGGRGSGLTSSAKPLAKLCKESFGARFGAARYLPPAAGSGEKKRQKTKTQVEKEIKNIADPKKRKDAWIEYSTRVTRRYGDFEHRTGKGGQDKKQWRQDRRVLVECIYDDWGPRNTFWVTNFTDRDASRLINQVYSRRANAELRIKDAKMFRCDKLSCQSFKANQFRLLLHVLAQRLMFLFRELIPPSKHRISLNHVKEHYICIPAIVETKSQRTNLIWSQNYPLKNRMHAVCARLTKSNGVRRAA